MLIGTAEERFLLLTGFGDFGAVEVLDAGIGIRKAALLYEARTGARVTSAATAAKIDETDSTLVGLTWLLEQPAQLPADENIQNEFQSIVQVPITDHWADYRPARPQDLVGRDEDLHTVFGLFESVRQRRSSKSQYSGVTNGHQLRKIPG
jgi:hypothetical protein